MPNANQSTTEANSHALEPVRKSIRVQCNPSLAFQVFTEQMDSWWPRSYHVGSAPLAEVHVECRRGGRVYSDQTDGTQCQWGSVLVWEPPVRFVMAWQVTPDWKPEHDLTKCSEVELVFSAVGADETLVELEHRNFERHQGLFAQMRETVSAEGGWGKLLELFAEKARSLKDDLKESEDL